MSSTSKSSSGRNRRKPGRYQEENLQVRCSNENCSEQGDLVNFRHCTRCSLYYCCHCCGLDEPVVKLLNSRNDNFWFCPQCAKPALNAIFWINILKNDVKVILNLLSQD